MDDQQIMPSQRQRPRGFDREEDRYISDEIHHDVAFRVALFAVREREGTDKYKIEITDEERSAAEKEMKANPPHNPRRRIA